MSAHQCRAHQTVSLKRGPASSLNSFLPKNCRKGNWLQARQVTSAVLRQKLQQESQCDMSQDCLSNVISLAPLALLTSALDAKADGLDVTKSAPGGVSIGEVIILLAPLILYGLFNVYRDQVNPKATISDFLFITAALVIVGNIFSIIVLKVRLF